MRDTARDPVPLDPLEQLRVQRSRLADRMRPPWWYLPGVAIVWALFFAGPFTSRSFSSPNRLAPGPSWSPYWRCASCCSGA